MTKEERIEYMRKYRAEHREKLREKWKNRRMEHKEEYRARKKKERAENRNKNGVTKSQIRVESGRILDKCHTKLSGYEIHHCFGYEDPNKFIYIPRELHLKIHQLLIDKKIQSDSNHWNLIRELVNECNEYTYIRT